MKKKITTLLIALGCIPLAAQAQTVHGVKGAALWFQAATVSDSLLNGEYHFADKSDMGLTLHVGTGTTEYTQSRSFINTFNFKPAIDLSKPVGGLLTTFSHAGLQQTTVMGVFAPKTSTQNTYVYQMSGTNGFSLYTGKIAYAGGSSDLSYHPNLTDTLCSDFGNADKTLPRIITYTRTLMPSHSLWDAPETRTLQLFSSFNGYCPEMIVFNRMLSITERRKVESYLALKYGLTLLDSYFDSSGNVIWDASTNSIFHHRVTGIGCDNSLSLLVSTTSYDDLGNSADRQNESFYNHDSYNLSGENRLLTIGRERGGSIDFGKHMVWGDNNQSVTASNGTWNVLQRRWKMRSSIANRQDTLSFDPSGLNVSGNNHLYAVSGTGNGKHVIIGPASSGDKCFEFTCPSSSTPTFQVGLFEKDSVAVCRYGYQFANGQVKRVVDGTVQTSCIYSNCKGMRVRIHRHGEWMSLSINNVFVEGSVFNVPINEPIIIPILNNDSFTPPDETDSSERLGDGGFVDPIEPNPHLYGPQQYNGIIATMSTGTLNIADLRIGGFSDTGNIVELSYKDIENFHLHHTDAYLLINTTGNTFYSPTMQKIRCSEVDESRKKLIFHNVQFPTGNLYFTFGWGTPPTSTAKESFALEEEATGVDTDDTPVFGVTPNGHNTREFTAWLDLPDSGPATLLVFDAAGRLNGEYDLRGSGRRTTTFSINYPGVYIVKALTDNQEYTKKITVK